MPLTSLLSVASRKLFREHLRKCRYGAAGTIVSEMEFQAPSGELVPIELHTRPTNWDGRLLCRTAILDLTDRKRAELAAQASASDLESRVAQRTEELRQKELQERQRSEQLQQLSEALASADRRKDEFLAILGHELRNPLAPIRNAVEVLRRLTPSLPELDEMWDIVERQSGQLTRLVDDLLDVSRISSGRILLRRTTVDLGPLVRQAAGDFRSVLEEAGLSLSISTPDRPLLVDVDPARITQVVGNLLSNARKFTDAGGHVHVSVTARENPSAAVIEVRDNGIGIAPEVLQQLFCAFVQADSSVSRSRGGLGLGLALVKGLIELHGGQVAADSACLGIGSRFTVTLPLSGDQPTAGTAREGSRAESLRVLVVEDNRDALHALKTLVRTIGHEVVAVGDGEAAAIIAAEFLPELVLSDIGLPGIDGLELARRLRNIPEMSSSYLIAVTGYGQAEDQRRAIEAGFDAHITKPLSPEALQAAIEAAIDSGRARRPE